MESFDIGSRFAVKLMALIFLVWIAKKLVIPAWVCGVPLGQ